MTFSFTPVSFWSTGIKLQHQNNPLLQREEGGDLVKKGRHKPLTNEAGMINSAFKSQLIHCLIARL